VKIKHLGFGKSLYEMKSKWITTRSGYKRKAYDNIQFLDTMTLSFALLGKAMSLDTLCKTLQLPDEQRKKERTEGILDDSATISKEDLEYAFQDIVATFACYRKLKGLYKEHGCSKPIHRLYSSASLGKAHLEEFGFRPFLKQHPDFDKKMLAVAMAGYFGGKSMIGYRLQPVEVLHADFKSQYPTVNTLMRLQDVLLAERVKIEDATEEIQRLVGRDVNELLAKLQHKDFWFKLAVYCQVQPDGQDMLPIRADYAHEVNNVGWPYVKSEIPLWYTLADVIASKLLTGKTPEVIEARKLVASKEKYETHTHSLMGLPSIDLNETDFFTEVINLRTKVKKQGGPLAESQQLGLKLIANGTSYGALVEMNQGEEKAEKTKHLFYTVDGEEEISFQAREGTPGKFFSGPVGALIPAAGRLLLAIAETLGKQRGLDIAFCDTDSSAFVRPENMSRDTFIKQFNDVLGWFDGLNPYNSDEHIFQSEKVNMWEGEYEPLYFIGVSAKRYVMFNRLKDGTYRIRKFSSHGMGGLAKPYRDDTSPFAQIPEPHKNVSDLGGARWTYDLWYSFIDALEHGHDLYDWAYQGRKMFPDKWGVPVFNCTMPELRVPAYHQVTVSTAHLYNQFKTLPYHRPFNFFVLLPSIDAKNNRGRIGMFVPDVIQNGDSPELIELITKKQFYNQVKRPLYAPLVKHPSELGYHNVRLIDNNELIPAWYDFVTVGEAINGYFNHPEAKAINGHQIGKMLPHHVNLDGVVYIGKESNEITFDLLYDTNELIIDDRYKYYANEYGGISNLSAVLQKYKVDDVMRASELPRRTVYNARKGKIQPSTKTKLQLMKAIQILQLEKQSA